MSGGVALRCSFCVMESHDTEYFIDGIRYVGHMALPAGTDPRPAVLVCHEGPGLSDHARSRARRLADELRYLAFALDYHGGGTTLPADEMWPKLSLLIGDQQLTRHRAQAGLDQLLAHPRADRSRVGAMGFCFGGTMALELGRGGAAVHAIVGFHSGLGSARPADAANITGKVLVCIGTDDPLIPPEQRTAFEAEMSAAGVDWQMNLYGGAAHSFTNELADGSRAGIQYHEPSDRRSWVAMANFFGEVFAS